ncbi:MAG TPA: hypothetical protein VGT40_12215 [Methylomirabilota bacterium]|nr:hypothetical protein [Methylomirabilota bacterium]
MLKIVVEETGKGAIVLHLEGQVIGPWVEELRRVCAPLLASGARVTVDLSTVSFVGREGLGLLGCLRNRNVTLANSAGLVAEQLRAEKG